MITMIKIRIRTWILLFKSFDACNIHSLALTKTNRKKLIANCTKQNVSLLKDKTLALSLVSKKPSK